MSATNKINLADYYYSFLKDLSKESKIDLIIKLASSLKAESKGENSSSETLFEALQSDEIAATVIAELKALKNGQLSKPDKASGVF